MAEILDASKAIKTARMRLRISDPAVRSCRANAEILARSLENCQLNSVVQRFSIEREESLGELGIDDAAMRNDDLLIAYTQSICEHPNMWKGKTPAHTVMRLVLNRRLLTRRGMRPVDVVRAIRNVYGRAYHIVGSPECSIEWVIRIRAMNEDDPETVAKLYAGMLSGTHLGGLPSIELAELIEVPVVIADSDGGLHNEEEIFIETAGSDMEKLVTIKGINWADSYSNDVMNVFANLGIAAARNVIFRELKGVISDDGNKVNDRHINMVAIAMTSQGVVMPMSRHGINRVAPVGPLLRCSFEEAADIITEAAAFAESDTFRGISQSIMAGQIAEMGTGCSEALTPHVSSGVLNNNNANNRKNVVVRSRFRGTPCGKYIPSSTRGLVDPPYQNTADNNPDPGSSGECGGVKSQFNLPYPIDGVSTPGGVDVQEVGGCRDLAMAALAKEIFTP